jgi:hypothetical protein
MPVRKSKPKLPSIATLKRHLAASPDPEISKHAPYVGAALKIVDYMFDAYHAAETAKVPQGVKIAALEICNKPGSELAERRMECAVWLFKCVTDSMENGLWDDLHPSI